MIPARGLRFGMYVHGRRVARVATAVCDGRPVVLVTYEGGARERYAATAAVPIVARRELPGGPVRAGWYCASNPKTRASDGKWRGERDGTRREQFMATAAAFATL